jgi:hypothetical protein
MAYIPGVQTNSGNYVPTTSLFDLEQLQKTDVNTPEFKELLVRLYQVINNISLSLNLKETGYYVLQEFVIGSQWFPSTPGTSLASINTYRQEFRLVMNIGVLLPGVTTTPHGLTIGSTWIFTEIRGCASLYNANPLLSNYYPIPFVLAAGGNNIEIELNGTNLVITNNTGISFSSCYVILQYLKM